MFTELPVRAVVVVSLFAAGCFVFDDGPAFPSETLTDSDLLTDSVSDADSGDSDLPDDVDDADEAITDRDLSDMPPGELDCGEGERRCNGADLVEACNALGEWTVAEEQCDEIANGVTLRCGAGSCIEIEEYGSFCGEDGDCGEGLRCYFGRCLTHDPTDQVGIACVDAFECRSPLLCVDGQCSAQDAIRCGELDECPPPRFCVEGYCVTGDVADPCLPNEDRLCAASTCVTVQCEQDDCGSLSTCENGSNESPCAGADDCDELECIASHCSNGAKGASCLDEDHCDEDLLCGPRGRCQEGIGEDPCDSNTQCAQQLFCGPNNECQVGEVGEPCATAEHCRGELICGGARCSNGTYSQGCDEDGDCVNGGYCLNLSCQDGRLGDACENSGHCQNGDCTDSECR